MQRSSRPSHLSGLIALALTLTLRRAKPRVVLALTLVIAGLGTCRACACLSGRADGGTFNIENYPKSEAQEQGAFEAIRDTGAPWLAVQEITQPVEFCHAARARLGPSWECVFTHRPAQRVGVLFDRAVFSLSLVKMHEEVAIYDGAKPAIQVGLAPKDGSPTLRVFVVHLKAGGDGHPVRERQLRALAPAISEAKRTNDRLIVLGDFNATGPDDTRSIAALAADTGLFFASKDLPCTAYWNRKDGCLGVPLDHVLTSFDVEVRAEGPCATEGCEMRPECPAFHGAVSDHCPVSLRY